MTGAAPLGWYDALPDRLRHTRVAPHTVNPIGRDMGAGLHALGAESRKRFANRLIAELLGGGHANMLRGRCRMGQGVLSRSNPRLRPMRQSFTGILETAGVVRHHTIAPPGPDTSPDWEDGEVTAHPSTAGSTSDRRNEVGPAAMLGPTSWFRSVTHPGSFE